MAATAPRWWQSRRLIACLFLPLSALFLGLSAARRLAYRLGWRAVRRAPVPVVVVGNIAVGGSGKTPVVVWLVEALKAAGYRPGIVSRGYGRSADGVHRVRTDDTSAEAGDEPLMLARLTGVPVVVGRDRPACIETLVAEHPSVDVIVSDDGLQHLAMARTAQIVVLDEAVLGNRWLLPAGPLREPLGRLAEVDLMILHGPVSEALRACLPNRPLAPMALIGTHFERLGARHEQCSPAAFAGRRVHALAGIGRPERFFDQLRTLGLEVVPHPFADHHAFCAEDLALPPGEPILLTEKDAVKCAPFAPEDTWVFPVRADIPAAAIQPILEKLEHHGRQTA